MTDVSCTLGCEDDAQQYMQDANLNSSTPISKIRILAQFLSHDFLK